MALKTYVTGSPPPPAPVAVLKLLGSRYGRQATCYVAASSKAEAEETLRSAHVQVSQRSLTVANGAGAQALRDAGLLSEPSVYAMGDGFRLVQAYPGEPTLVGWAFHNPASFLPADAIPADEVEALVKILDGNERQALQVLAAGYRRAL